MLTNEQIEQAANKHADELRVSSSIPGALVPLLHDIAKSSYIYGAQDALASQWVSVEDALPEEKKVVLCYTPNMKDNYAEKDIYFDMAILLEGEFINLDAEVVHPSHWMPIPIPQLNPEKEER